MLLILEAGQISGVYGFGPGVEAHGGSTFVLMAQDFPRDGEGPQVCRQDGTDVLDPIDKLNGRDEHWMTPDWVRASVPHL